MRIVIVGQTYYPGNNGQAVFTIRLAEGLAKAGHDVAAVVPSTTFRTHHSILNNVQLLNVAGIHTPAIHGNVYITPFPEQPIRRFFRAFKPDIVHIQDHYFLSRAALQIARRQKVKVIGTNHFLPANLSQHIPGLKWGRKQIDRLLWWTMKDVYRHLDFVTTPTETAAGILRQRELNVPIRAVSCGVNLEDFNTQPDVSRAEIFSRYKLNPTRSTLLYVGRIDPEKNLEVVIRAIHQLENPNLQLAIVGQGKHTAKLRALIESLDLTNQIVLTGFVTDEDLPMLIHHADIFAMPSRAELQSIATMEAMACGKPILAADACALPELVENSYNGYLFQADSVENAAQCIVQLISQRDRWKMMGFNSFSKVQKHAFRNTIQNYEAVYSQVLSATKAFGLKKQPSYQSTY